MTHMGCATNATPLVTVYAWHISKYATHNLPMRGAYCYMRPSAPLVAFENSKKFKKI
jgi:hypothetical protein